MNFSYYVGYTVGKPLAAFISLSDAVGYSKESTNYKIWTEDNEELPKDFNRAHHIVFGPSHFDKDGQPI